MDEAAGLAAAIETEVLEQLLPEGFQVVVTSRPEGVIHPDRWANKCVIMNLRPLDHEQQMHLVKQQVGLGTWNSIRQTKTNIILIPPTRTQLNPTQPT